MLHPDGLTLLLVYDLSALCGLLPSTFTSHSKCFCLHIVCALLYYTLAADYSCCVLTYLETMYLLLLFALYLLLRVPLLPLAITCSCNPPNPLYNILLRKLSCVYQQAS